MTDRAVRLFAAAARAWALNVWAAMLSRCCDQADAVVELGRPGLPPQRDLGDAVIEGLQDALPHPRVAAEQIRRGRQGLRAGTDSHRRQGVFEVERLGAEDLQRPIIGVVG